MKSRAGVDHKGLVLLAFFALTPWCRAELVAHFPLDGDAESTVGDFEGDVDDGVEFVADGIFGGSAEFEGFGGIHVPYDEALNPEDAFTVTAWVNPIETTSWNSVVTSREDNGTSVNGYIIYNTDGSNQWDFWTGGGGPPGAWGRNVSPEVAELEEWTHLAITYDGETDTKILWVNGEDVAEVSGQGYIPNGTTEATARPFNIGAGQDFGDGFFFVGQIDDVSVWNEALDSDGVNCVLTQGAAACGNPGGTAGDFNVDGVLDAADINLLTSEILSGGMRPAFDVNGDGSFDNSDRNYWVETLKKTWLGDSNLDGEFGSSDFVDVFTAGQYEDGIDGNSTWETGDWNGDTEFDTSDFVAAFTAGGYEMGPRPAVAAVPEPTSLSCLAMLCCAGLSLGMRRGRAQR